MTVRSRRVRRRTLVAGFVAHRLCLELQARDVVDEEEDERELVHS